MAAEAETNPALCRLTTSALNTIEGQPFVLWWLFDHPAPDVIHRPYEERFGALKRRYWDIYQAQPELAQHLRIMPCQYVTSMEEVDRVHTAFMAQGYEGSILRDPNGKYKNGRSTPTEGGLLRIKDFVEEEFLIMGIEEGETNENEATINELGQTERSTHMANMVPNGMVGAFVGMDLKTKKPIKVAAGKLPHDLRRLYFQQQHLVLQKVGKYKTFLVGVKDKPRFPTFQSLKAESDL
jgi:DNA ligase-1